MTGRDLAGAPATGPVVVELVCADIAARLDLPLGEAAGGGPATWALWCGHRTLALTDELFTDEQATGWAARLLGETVQFRCGHIGGGYWLATASIVPAAGGGWS